MPITKTGKRSYEINPSEALRKLMKYEQEQLHENKNIIQEQDFLPRWIHRTCPNCFTQMANKNNIFKCEKCGIVKVPIGINYKPEEEN